LLSSTRAAFCSQHPARQVAPPQASPDHFAVREWRGRRKFRKRSRRLRHAFQLAHSQAWASARAENKPVFFLVAEERSSFRRGLILSRNGNFFKERKKERKKCESRGGSVGSAAQSHADLLTSVGPLHALTLRSSNCTGKSAGIYQCDCGPGIPTAAFVLTHRFGLVFPSSCLFIRIVHDKGRYRQLPPRCREFPTS